MRRAQFVIGLAWTSLALLRAGAVPDAVDSPTPDPSTQRSAPTRPATSTVEPEVDPHPLPSVEPAPVPIPETPPGSPSPSPVSESVPTLAREPTQAVPSAPATAVPGFEPKREYAGPALNPWLEAQIELARRGFSSGSIDGVPGLKTHAALRAFQQSHALPPTGDLDVATRAYLALSSPPIMQRTLTADEIAGLQPLSRTWLGKSLQTALAYETALEAAAERFHSSPALLRRLNGAVDWTAVTTDTLLTVPAIERVTLKGRIARIQIRLAECALEALDGGGNVLGHFPVSIAREAASRPVGEMRVTVTIANPNYTFDPAVFPESAEARELGRKLILSPGPNNPVGVAWLGLDRPGYGIHGTPSPERVGVPESHGCFRLTNWDARTLLEAAWVGMPVNVDP